jgi:hypothetical protein
MKNITLANSAFIPDPGFFSIPDPTFFHPSSPDPGSASKNSSILTQKMVSYLSEM